jgi:hypothetical protein
MEGAAQRTATRWVRQGVNAPFASDTDVVLARIHAVDDTATPGPRSSAPESFLGARDVSFELPRSSDGLATE